LKVSEVTAPQAPKNSTHLTNNGIVTKEFVDEAKADK
jgi:hypothetical protein